MGRRERRTRSVLETPKSSLALDRRLIVSNLVSSETGTCMIEYLIGAYSFLMTRDPYCSDGDW